MHGSRRSLGLPRSPVLLGILFVGVVLCPWETWGRTLNLPVLQCASRDDWRCARSMHEFSAKDIDGHMICLDKYKWVPGYVGGARPV